MPAVEITNRTNKHFSMSYMVPALGKDVGDDEVSQNATYHPANINVEPGSTGRFEVPEFAFTKVAKQMEAQHKYGIFPDDHDEAGEITYRMFA